MDRLSRLRDIVRSGPAARVPPVPPRRELVYELVDDDGLPLDERRDLPSLDGAAWVDTPYGRVVVVDYEFPPEFVHGRVLVQDLATWDAEALALINGRPLHRRSGRHRPRSPLFFDLETTGLSGGAGTVPFLVGCGYFEEGAFRTRQFFLQGFAAERALLDAFTGFLDDVSLIVTYNGRTFDMPVMETRWSFHRMPVPLDGISHLDMLPPSRRLWKDGAEAVEHSCRLVSLEALLCGVSRVGDVPGAEIPQRYFEYVRGGDARLLEPVLYHNRMDLLSLAALTARAQRLVTTGAEAADDVSECVALGRLFERRGSRGEAERCYRRAIASPEATANQREQARLALALLLRRSRRFGEAASVWHALVAGGAARTPAVREAVRALAVHHEHRERDLTRAHALAQRALHAERDPRRQDEVRHRLARLERKLGQTGRDIRQQPHLIEPEPGGPEGTGDQPAGDRPRFP